MNLLITVMGAIEGGVIAALQAGWGDFGVGDGKPLEGPSIGLLIRVPKLVGAPAVVALVALLARARR